MRLLQQPNTNANTTVNFVASNDKITLIDKHGDSASVVGLGFDEDNWQTNRQLIIVGEQDADDIDDRATINIFVISSDPDFKSANPPAMTVYVADDEVPSIIVTGAPQPVEEGTTSTYTVSLNAEPQDNTTISFSSNNPDVTFDPSTSLTHGQRLDGPARTWK